MNLNQNHSPEHQDANKLPLSLYALSISNLGNANEKRWLNAPDKIYPISKEGEYLEIYLPEKEDKPIEAEITEITESQHITHIEEITPAVPESQDKEKPEQKNEPTVTPIVPKQTQQLTNTYSSSNTKVTMSQDANFYSWLAGLNKAQLYNEEESLPIQPSTPAKPEIPFENTKTKAKKTGVKADLEKEIKQSQELVDDIVSETLAQLYQKQGHLDQAIETYKKLSLVYPEKSRYFADQIKKLKS